MIKIGIGQDSHKYENDTSKPLILGGVKISDKHGLKANSDGDVLIHALCNAITSSIGKGSLSNFADQMYREGIVDSREYLKTALAYLKHDCYKINNISICIETQKPKLEKYFPKIKKILANICQIREQDVGITVTSGERLTVFGKGLGIQVFAAVTIIKC